MQVKLKMNFRTVIALLLMPMAVSATDLSVARNWTGQSGKIFEATFVESRDDGTVVFNKPGGTPMRVYAKHLSQADRELIELGQTRTWTSRSGTTVDGALVASRFGRCHIRKKDGTMVAIQATQLSAEDQAIVKQASSLDLYFSSLYKARERVAKDADGRSAELAVKTAARYRPDDISLVFLNDAIEAAKAPADELTIKLGRKYEGTGDETLELIYVKPGSFTMGCQATPDDHFKEEEGKLMSYAHDPWAGNGKPLHKVTFTKGYYLGKTEVTWAQFASFIQDTRYQTDADRQGFSMGGTKHGDWLKIEGANWEKPGLYEQAPEKPVTCISWNDAQAFCKWASKKSRYDVRLPTEAEWEYACRAGTTTIWYTGDTPRDLATVGFWMNKNTPGWEPGCGPIAAGSLKPNAWGFYDMHGNCHEWVADYYTHYTGEDLVDPFFDEFPDEILNYHYKYQTTEDKARSFWSIGRPDQGRRILRGGGWCTPGVGNQSGFRRHEKPHNHLWYFSFRVAVTPKGVAK